MDNQEIFEKVRECLVSVLDVDSDDVSPASRLTEDLDAESIDFVDIIYRLEQTFRVKIPQGELFPQELVSNKEFVEAGVVTEKGIAELRRRYPFLDLAGRTSVRVTELPSLYTVEMLVRYLTKKVS